MLLDHLYFISILLSYSFNFLDFSETESEEKLVHS